jgi:hypothetical protein
MECHCGKPLNDHPDAFTRQLCTGCYLAHEWGVPCCGAETVCHCGNAVYVHADGFTRDLCEECDSVRCDLPNELGKPYCEIRAAIIAAKPLNVSKPSIVLPVTAEQLIDAGHPAPPGYVAAPAIVLTRRQAALLWWHSWVYDTRRRLGYWIAGDTPGDEW